MVALCLGTHDFISLPSKETMIDSLLLCIPTDHKSSTKVDGKYTQQIRRNISWVIWLLKGDCMEKKCICTTGQMSGLSATPY